MQMDKIQIHPTGFIDPQAPTSRNKILGPESLRGVGGILVNKFGRRFVDELTRRGIVTEAILQNGDLRYSNLDSGKVQLSASILLNEDVRVY